MRITSHAERNQGSSNASNEDAPLIQSVMSFTRHFSWLSIVGPASTSRGSMCSEYSGSSNSLVDFHSADFDEDPDGGESEVHIDKPNRESNYGQH